MTEINKIKLKKDWEKLKPQYSEKKDGKILPSTNGRNILITSALPYVNNVPHLGNIIGCVLSADVFARYSRLRGHTTLYIGGTDEYGTATETKALQEGCTPRELCDKYHEVHKQIYQWFGIDFDHFGRTTTDQQTEIAQDIFHKLHKNGFTSTSSVDQLYCKQCEKFLADRFVTGTCPLCAYDDARGDQCDGCAKVSSVQESSRNQTINAYFLGVGQTAVNYDLNNAEDDFLENFKRVFFQDETKVYVTKQLEKVDNRWSANAVSIVKSWIKQGFEPRCITRDLKWGTPVPLEGFKNKVFYVWYDAPIGYLSITKCLLGDDWTKWWKNPSNVECFNFVGKDNVAFHGVMFPCTQIGANDNYTIVNNLCATEYLNYEDTKFSKSRGTGVFGDAARDTGIPADVWRFYLLYMRPESQDTAFSWDDFFFKVNSELLNNLGNFVNRALTFAANFFQGIVPPMDLNDDDLEFLAGIQEDSQEWDRLFDKVHLKDAVKVILNVSRRGNQYMQSQTPWVLMKGDEEKKKRAGTVIGIAVNIAYHLSVLLFPIMPKISETIRTQCGLPKLPLFSVQPLVYLPAGHKIGQPTPLFEKLDAAKVTELKARFGGEPATAQEKVETKKPKKESKEKSKNPKEVSTKDKKSTKLNMAGRVFPVLAKNQNSIRQLLDANQKKFEQARQLFLREKLAALEKENKSLEQQVETVQKKLIDAEVAGGVKQIPVPKQAPAAQNGSAPAPVAATSTAAPAKKPASEAKPKAEKKKGGAAPAPAAANDEIDIGRLDLRVGRILNCEKHPDADALYVEKIDVGEAEPRTVVSGLVKHVPLDQMQNRLVVVLCNLKPVKMRGVESRAMVMCASSPEKVEVMEVDPASKPGTPVLCPPFTHRPDAQLNPKKKVWETIAEDLKVSPEGFAAWKEHALLVGGETKMTAATLRNVFVK